MADVGRQGEFTERPGSGGHGMVAAVHQGEGLHVTERVEVGTYRGEPALQVTPTPVAGVGRQRRPLRRHPAAEPVHLTGLQPLG